MVRGTRRYNDAHQTKRNETRWNTHKKIKALHRANYLYDAYWRAQGAKDRAEIKDALEALFRGEHPDFLGVKISHAAFDLKSIPTWDTAFVYVLKNVPTHDKGIMFKHRPTRDEEPEELFDDDGTAVEMINRPQNRRPSEASQKRKSGSCARRHQ